MQATIKQLLRVLTDMQNNPPALVAIVAISAMGVATFALYVVLSVVKQ
jgi:hypothetical protein